MKIALINGSPKTANSASGYFAEEFRTLLPQSAKVSLFSANQLERADASLAPLFACNRWIFFFPLYVDAVPSHLLQLLMRIESESKSWETGAISVYAVVNCGFYEALQNRNALDVIHHFCDHCGLSWKYGIGIGAGGFVGNSPEMPLQSSLKKPVFFSLKELAASLQEENQPRENRFVEPRIPRFLYRRFGDLSWKQDARRNHLKIKELYQR